MRRKPSTFNRRKLLQGLAAGVVASQIPSLAAARSSRVLVIGAGLAGLSAARLLRSQDVEVQVLEARDRIGGRVYSLDQVPGTPEGGANVIGPNYGRVIDAARTLGVALRPSERAADTGLVIDGVRMLSDDWPQSTLNTTHAALHSIPPSRLLGPALRENPLGKSTDWFNPSMAKFDVSAATYLKDRGYDEQALALLSANNSYGNTLQDTSMLSLFRVGNNFARAGAMRQPAFVATAGNSRIPEALAASLEFPVLTGVDVQMLRQGNDGVSAIDSSGNTYHADRVIVALPLPALRRLRIEGIDKTHRQAQSEVEYHKVTQVHLLADRQYWHEDLPGSWWTNGQIGRLFLSPAKSAALPHNLTAWINGNDCDHFQGLPDEEIGARALHEIETILPEARGALSVSAVVDWAADPYAGGTWAAWRPGQIQTLFKALQAASGRVHFAGEHTGRANPGMEAAMESGERAALEALRHFA